MSRVSRSSLWSLCLARLALVAAGGLARVVLIDVRPDVDERHASKLHAVAANLCEKLPGTPVVFFYHWPAAGASATARKYGGSSLGPTAGRVAGRRRTHAHFLRATILGHASASRRHTRNFNFVWCLCAEGKLERDVSTGEIRGI